MQSIHIKKLRVVLFITLLIANHGILSRHRTEIQHQTCMMILDCDGIERPEHDTLEGMTLNLMYAIKAYNFPILVSPSILYNFLARKAHAHDSQHSENFYLASIHFSQQDWKIYDVPDVQLFLLIPRFMSWPFFNRSMIDVSGLISKGNLISYISKKRKTHTFTLKEIKKLFPRPSKGEIWDFFIAGHGGAHGYIADMNARELTKIIRYINHQLEVGVVYLSSCYAGGKNREIVAGELDVLGVSFPILFGSISDIETFSENCGDEFYKKFFAAARDLNGKGHSLNNFLRSINALSSHEQDIHGIKNIAQIYLPKTGGFYVHNIDKRIGVFGTVKVRAQEINQKPLLVKPSMQAVLVYPKIILPNIIVSGPTVISDNWRLGNGLKDPKTTWRYAPSFSEIYHTHQDAFKKVRADFPALTWLGRGKDYLNLDALFPQFIAMQTGDQVCQFAMITLKSDRLGCGVLHFIRDAFFYPETRISHKIFLIDKLTGPNDLSYILEAFRLIKGSLSLSLLEQELNAAIGRDVELCNIIIDNKASAISFIYNKQAWQYSVNKGAADGWRFERINLNDYIKCYQGLEKTAHS